MYLIIQRTRSYDLQNNISMPQFCDIQKYLAKP